MAKGTRKHRKRDAAPRWRVARAGALAVFTGAALGVLEGAIYPSHEGPRIALPLYWAVLAFLMWRLQPGKYGVAFLPLGLVAQDALSLLLQGMNPLTATWYESVFGRNVLTAHDYGVPNWYLVAAGASLLAAGGVRAADAVAAWRAARARRRPRASR